MDSLPEERLALFPDAVQLMASADGIRLSVGGADLSALAEDYGTPLYVYDRATLDRAVTTYRDGLAAHFPGQSGITYAGKAYLCTAVAQWVEAMGLRLDCSSEGELRMALAGEIDRQRILVHGVNKSPDLLSAALTRAGIIVIDSLEELDRLEAIWPPGSPSVPELWLRYRPGIDAKTHASTQTGQSASKFGMDSAEIEQAQRSCRRAGLPLSGLHFHLGSQMCDVSPYGEALDRSLDLAAKLGLHDGWALSPGGGLGVAYHEDDLPHPDVTAYVRFVSDRIVHGCRLRRLPLPRLYLEPGRSLIARAGVALYRIGAVKTSGGRRWLLVDGGLADNPRPALYQARYSALPVWEPGRPIAGPAWLGGPYCESGDVLIEALPLPMVGPGEVIAVPMSGAYHLSMASNYNAACRPAVLWLDRDSARLIQHREQPEHLLQRDLRLPF